VKPRRNTALAWALIASLVLLSVLLDHFRMLTSYFNWFMVIQLTAVATVIAGVIFLVRQPEPGDAQASSKAPAETGRDTN